MLFFSSVYLLHQYKWPSTKALSFLSPPCLVFKEDLWASCRASPKCFLLRGKRSLAGALLSNGAFALQWGPNPSRGVHGRGDSYLVSADFTVSASPLEGWESKPKHLGHDLLKNASGVQASYSMACYKKHFHAAPRSFLQRSLPREQGRSFGAPLLCGFWLVAASKPRAVSSGRSMRPMVNICVVPHGPHLEKLSLWMWFFPGSVAAGVFLKTRPAHMSWVHRLLNKVISWFYWLSSQCNFRN